MKVTAVGVVRMTGKKEGRDYDFCNLGSSQKTENKAR